MQEENTLRCIKNGEKKTIEFKLCSKDLPKSIYETICSFLNTKGGKIFLGVDDNCNIIGIDKENIANIKKNFSNNINNSEIINPVFALDIEEIEIDNKIILLIQVPESSEVHRYKNKIYIRNHEGDYDITNNQRMVFNLYLTKKHIYTENIIFPYATMENNLREDLINRAKNLFFLKTGNEDWKNMDNLTFLKKNSLYMEDTTTKTKGFTLACILLFGDDITIHNVAPGYRIDLLKRIDDEERYDDREIIETNLIEAYDKSLKFIQKHLPDPFYLEKDTRISIRDIIFREVISNMLIHTEYSKGEVSKFTIYKDRIIAENGNKPFINGIIKSNNCETFQKNPNISKIFRMMGKAEQIGSGTLKLFKYCKAFGGNEPILKDENTFRFILPVNIFNYRMNSNEIIKINQNNVKDTQQDIQQDTQQDTQQDNILNFCTKPKSMKEIMNFVGLKDRINFIKNYIKPLIQQNKLALTIPDKPTSRNQKYITIKNNNNNN